MRPSLLSSDALTAPSGRVAQLIRRTEAAGYDRRRLALVAAHVATLLAGGVTLLYFNRDQWFFGDDWEFIVGRGLSHARHGLWYPHNEHWSTLPILLYRTLFTVFGVRTYLPYISALIAAHLLVAHMLWRVLVKIGADWWLLTGLTAVFVVLGAGSENLLWAFQIGFVASVMFGYAALLLVDHRGVFSHRDILGILALIAGLMCSGIGVTMVAVSGIAILLRIGWREWPRALVVTAIPAAVYVVWFALVGHKGLTGDQLSPSTFLDIPTWIWTGLSTAFERTAGFAGSGPVLVLALLAWLIYRSPQTQRGSGPAYALAFGMVLLFFIIALGRSRLGVTQAQAPRYAYLAMALGLPSIALAMTHLTGLRTSGRVGAVGIIVLVAMTNLALLRQTANARTNDNRHLERQIIAAADLLNSGQPVVGTQPEPDFDPDITNEALLRLYRNHRLPTVTIGDADRVAAETALQVAVADSPPLPGRFQPPIAVRATATVNGPCVDVQPTEATPQVVLQTPSTGASVEIANAGGGQLLVFLQPDPSQPVGRARAFALAPRHRSYLAVSRAGATVIVTVPATGVTEFCQLAG